MRFLGAALITACVICSPVYGAGGGANESAKLDSRANSDHSTEALGDSVRYQLLTLSQYGVFDWIEAEVRPDATVVLSGEVRSPTTKSEAEEHIRRLESVEHVKNRIEVLPVSPVDDSIRLATYRAIFDYDGPLFRYALPSVPPIHILVDNGRVTLRGVVSSNMDRQLAYTAARGVSGVLDVKNDLQVEG